METMNKSYDSCTILQISNIEIFKNMCKIALSNCMPQYYLHYDHDALVL